MGNHVYGSWRGRGVIRGVAVGRANSNSPRQAALRAGLAAAAKAWQNQLNNNQRDLWELIAFRAAAGGDPASATEPGSRVVIPQPQPVLSGYDAFVRSTQLTVECGINPIGTPVLTPGLAFPSPPTGLIRDEAPVIPVNFSLFFDGVNEDVTCGNVLPWDYNEPWAWEFWLDLHETITGQRILAKMTAPAFKGYVIKWDANWLYFNIQDASTGKLLSVRRAYNVFDVWNHIVCTYDGSNNANGMKIYINGVVGQAVVSNIPFVFSIQTTTPLTFASENAQAGSWLNGRLDAIRTYNRNLIQADVDIVFAGFAGLFDPDPFSDGSCQGYWPVCTGAGNTLFDLSGNNYHGTLRNMEPADWVLGKVPCPSIPGVKQLEWVDPDDLPDGGKIRVWCLSYDAHVHRQHVATVDKGVEAFVPTTVRGARGADIPIASMPGHYLFQIDAVSPDGNRSPPSNTISVVCPLV